LGATAIPQAQHDLRSETLAIALRSGIHRVIQEQDFLNRINVFPVADGDTGTNLSLSLGAALETIARNESNPLCTLLAALADALLDSARGNSGAIVAQFFQGLSDYAESLDHFSTHTFAGAVSLGSEYARDALANPREGTVLSVIAVFASSLRQQTEADHAIGFARMLNEALVAMQSALVKTTEQLEELRKADVVDAGASGFVTLIEGMTAFIADGEVSEEPELSALFDEAVVMETAGDIADVKYRFCTECIVTGDDIDRRKLRESLSALGDSLVLAGTKRKAKIHIHVNEPEAVFDVARIFGRLAGEKADDMLHQQQSTHDMRTRFAVITDSAADISDEDMERHDIHMVPVRIQFGDRGYLDKVSISSQEFFRELAENPVHPTSSQPSPGDFRRQYQFLASHFPDVISINLTPEVSGTLQAAQSAASRVNAAGTVHIVNSKNASLGQGLLAVFAAECAEAGLDTGEALQAIDTLSFAQVPRRLAAHYPGTAYRSRRQDYGEPLLARTAEPAVQIRTTHRKALQACGKPAGRYRARAV
jgi:dihydroxyacetone kinase-like predicted kinase